MKYCEHFVLIRGLLRETRHWGGFTEYLQQQFPNANIIMLDIPGNGRLHRATSPETIAGMTEALREQVLIRQPLRLIALSMGGMIAIDWMMRYPDEVEAAVLINTSARPLSPFYHRLRWTIYPYAIKMIFRSALQKESDILTLTSNRHSHNSKLLESWQQWQRENPVSTVSTRNQFLAALKFSVTSKPKQPVLIVASQADHLVDYRCSLKLAQAWQTDYVQHDTAGHDLPLDEPEWLANVIKQWFNPDLSSTAEI
ncbi:alpha/beta hydrolase [Nitrosomonas sp. Is37]|uniref:alpha/beta fold hydrolase n=1 Tax=Nitrosomonas sp. Is37 TaxID=3080535 RepID=UPI00294B84B4|nr:alpha/beta hydrolase [Nitrosomonas sp. Is37]MDV6343183.1 alpha/beta hydrolase [Nitrosomonas sp. Is37]